MLTIILQILFLFVIILLVTFGWAGILAAPWVPIRKRDVRRILRLANIKAGETVYDLGSGDGRLLIVAVKEFNAKPVGYEISVLPYFLSWVKIRILSLQSKIQLKYKNFFTADLSNADVIITFLSNRAMKILESKFKNELKPGCRIVSYVFKIKDWKPVAVDKPNEKELGIYLYKV